MISFFEMIIQIIENIWIADARTNSTSVAIWACKENKKVEISIIGERPFTEYSRCKLSYSILGEIPGFENWCFVLKVNMLSY